MKYFFQSVAFHSGRFGNGVGVVYGVQAIYQKKVLAVRGSSRSAHEGQSALKNAICVHFTGNKQLSSGSGEFLSNWGTLNILGLELRDYWDFEKRSLD